MVIEINSASSGAPNKAIAAPSPVSSKIRSFCATFLIASLMRRLNCFFCAICSASVALEYPTISKKITVQIEVLFKRSFICISWFLSMQFRGSHSPQRSAAVCTGLSQCCLISLSKTHTVTEAPAISSAVV